jgi:hypothetical protein
MTEGEFIVVLIVEDVEEVSIEGVNVFDFREVVEYVD